MIGNSDDETNFQHKLLFTNREVPNLRKSFANNSSVSIKLSKTQLSKIVQSGGVLGRLLGSLLKTGLPLMKNVIKPLAKSVLIPLELTAAATAAAAADAGIHNKISGSGTCPLDFAEQTTLTILNDEMEDIIKIVNLLKILIYY